MRGLISWGSFVCLGSGGQKPRLRGKRRDTGRREFERASEKAQAKTGTEHFVIREYEITIRGRVGVLDAWIAIGYLIGTRYASLE
jgi:hypothetical protein